MKTASVLLLAASVLTGCTHNLSKAYKPQPAIVNAPKAEMLFVEYPVENRPLKGQSKVWNVMLILVPLVPYANTVMSPEYAMRGRYKFGYSFATDLHDVIVKDIKVSGLVTDVRASQKRVKTVDTEFDPSLIVRPSIAWEGGATHALPAGCRVLSLKLDEGVMNGSSTAYGLSVAAFPLWLLGVPMTYGNFDLKVTATLKTAEGRVVAERSFSHKRDFYQLLYNKDAGLRAMPKAYEGLSAELRGFLKETL